MELRGPALLPYPFLQLPVYFASAVAALIHVHCDGFCAVVAWGLADGVFKVLRDVDDGLDCVYDALEFLLHFASRNSVFRCPSFFEYVFEAVSDLAESLLNSGGDLLHLNGLLGENGILSLRNFCLSVGQFVKGIRDCGEGLLFLDDALYI